MAIGMATWAVALVGPAGLIMIGATRLARILATARGSGPRRRSTLKALDDLPDDVTVATGLTLPDGRGVSELVIGPFGAAVIRELPPPAVTRVRGGTGKSASRAAGSRSRTRSTGPSRDAERVRRWITDDDDFLVKVYAAVVGPDRRSLERRPAPS